MDLVMLLAIVLIVISLANFLKIIQIAHAASKVTISIAKFIIFRGPIAILLLITGIFLLLIATGYISI